MCQLVSQICFNPHLSNYDEFTEDNPSYYLPPPSIIKPELWTGKQILSCILPRISWVKIINGVFGKWTDDIIIIQNGELLLGRLCKVTLGGGTSLIHTLWKDFGKSIT